MIYSETISIVHSEVVARGISSEIDADYRVLDTILRLTEDNDERRTEENDLRTLE